VRGPLPSIRVESAAFWSYAQAREFRAQRCSSCGRVRWPASPVCFDCLGFEATWVPLTDHGILRSWVTYRRTYLPEFEAPYSVGLVELPESVRYPSLLVGDGPWEYEQPLSLTFIEVEDRGGERMLLPAFEPR
jgi:uncharacterized OB-fold protein